MYKILVVDDEPKIREVIKEYGEFSGYEITEADDGITAVGLCKLNDYDLIIMDIMMPKLDGFSACKEIKKIKDIPVIMLSARGEEYDKLFGFELGIDDYVVKPFSPKELMARVNAVLARKKAAAQPQSQVMKFDGLEINIAARTVCCSIWSKTRTSPCPEINCSRIFGAMISSVTTEPSTRTSKICATTWALTEILS